TGSTSIDGGRTWVDRGTLPKPPATGFTWTSDPVLAVNEKTGAIYFSALCDLIVNSAARSGIAVVKGRWNGDTFNWETPVVARTDVPLALDKEWIVADSVSDKVYLSYSNFASGLSR